MFYTQKGADNSLFIQPCLSSNAWPWRTKSDRKASILSNLEYCSNRGKCSLTAGIATVALVSQPSCNHPDKRVSPPCLVCHQRTPVKHSSEELSSFLLLILLDHRGRPPKPQTVHYIKKKNNLSHPCDNWLAGTLLLVQLPPTFNVSCNCQKLAFTRGVSKSYRGLKWTFLFWP